MFISDKELDVYFNDIEECVDAVKDHQQALNADKIKDYLKQVTMYTDCIFGTQIKGALDNIFKFSLCLNFIYQKLIPNLQIQKEKLKNSF